MKTLGQKLKLLREQKGLSQDEVCRHLNIEQSTLANYENDKRTPKIDILGKIAAFYNIPTDYLLGAGIFSDWDKLLENKNSIIKHISIMASQLSSDILNGLDDISFAKLVYAFNINLHSNEDDNTTGITATSPIPTFSDISSPVIQVSDSNEKRLLSIFRNLSDDDQMIIMGKALDLKKMSVAADEQIKEAK